MSFHAGSGASIGGEEALRDQLRALQAQLDRAMAQNEELQRDVESLCMQGAGESIFASSSVLADLKASIEKELAATKVKLRSVIQEKSELEEDLKGLRESKRSADVLFQKERERNTGLEKQLTFFQSQISAAIEGRDKASWEAEELREQMLKLEALQRQAEGKAMSEEASRLEAERQLAIARQQMQGMKRQVQEAEALPALRLELAAARQEIVTLQQHREQIQKHLEQERQRASEAQLAVTQAHQEVSNMSQQLKGARKGASAAATNHQYQLKKLQEELAAAHQATTEAKQGWDDAEGALAAAEAEIEVIRRETETAIAQERSSIAAAVAQAKEEAAKEVAEGESRYQQLRGELQDASREKVYALLAQSTAESACARAEEELARLRKEVGDLRAQLAQATKEKVESLMQVSQLKGESNGSMQRPEQKMAPPASRFFMPPIVHNLASGGKKSSPWGMWGPATRDKQDVVPVSTGSSIADGKPSSHAKPSSDTDHTS